MAGVFPSQRNYKFSSSLLNLKFMKRSTNDEGETKKALSDRDRAKLKGAPALTQLEANRREMEARTQLTSYVAVEEEYSFSRLYDLVSGRFDFRNVETQDDTNSKSAAKNKSGENSSSDRKRKAETRNGEAQSDEEGNSPEEDAQVSKSQGGRYFTSYSKSARFADARKRRRGKNFNQTKKRSRNNAE